MDLSEDDGWIVVKNKKKINKNRKRKEQKEKKKEKLKKESKEKLEKEIKKDFSEKLEKAKKDVISQKPMNSQNKYEFRICDNLYVLELEDDYRIWKDRNGKIITKFNTKDCIFDIHDLELCYLLIDSNLTDIGYKSIDKDNLYTNVYKCLLPGDLIRSILDTKLPKNFWVAYFERDYCDHHGTAIAKTYRFIYSWRGNQEHDPELKSFSIYLETGEYDQIIVNDFMIMCYKKSFMYPIKPIFQWIILNISFFPKDSEGDDVYDKYDYNHKFPFRRCLNIGVGRD
tara:strand:- start:1093 stop:1944 length:852 start_codon:yes stop_codon:yes gene_type:complete